MTSTMNVTTQRSRSFEHLHFFFILQLFVRDKFFSDMARVVLHGTSFSLSITLLKTVLDQWEGEFLQLDSSRTRALFFVQEKIVKK